jgi:hypothetical protein
MLGRQFVVLALTAALLASGAVAAKAFTLIPPVNVTVSPTSGLPTAPFTARATVTADCAVFTWAYYFDFHWDTAANPTFWSVIRVFCDPKTGRYDTGSSPAFTPPSGQNTIGSHKVVVVMKDGSGATVAVGSHAYTIVWGKPYVTVSPTSGIPTAPFNVRGKFVWPGPCPGTRAPSSITFKFSWYKVTTSIIPLWTKTVSTCSGGVVDTGNSPALIPPSPLNYPSTFVVHVGVFDSSGSGYGRIYGAAYTNTTIYTVLSPPPASPIATPAGGCGSPGQAACPTPTSSPCTVQPAAFVHPITPGMSDAAAIVALAALGMLPIGGLAMFLVPGLWTRRGRWGRLPVIAMSVMLLSLEACAAITNQTAQVTPTQSETSPSPSPSPTPTC